MICSKCGFDNLPTMRFCGNCGQALLVSCLYCQMDNPAFYRFCGNCGQSLIEGAAARPEFGLQPGASGRAQPDDARRAPVPDFNIRFNLPAPWNQPDTGEELTFTPSMRPAPPPEKVEQKESAATQTQRRVVSVLSARLSHLPQERIVTRDENWFLLFNRILQVLETEVLRFGGAVDRYEENGLMAVFGANTVHEDDPERAVLAALAMQQAFGGQALQLETENAMGSSLQIGISTGEVTITQAGERGVADRDALSGRAVTLAERLADAAGRGTVLASIETYHLTEARFEWLQHGEITVDEDAGPVGVYRAIRPLELAALERHHYGHDLPLIGRVHEYEMLKARVESLCNGRGGIALISGGKGMGKSFLLNQVREYFVHKRSIVKDSLDEEDQVVCRMSWLQGRSRSYDQWTPYSIWVEILRAWLGLEQDESLEQAREQLKTQCRRLWGEEEYQKYYPYLATFLSIPLEEAEAERVKYLDASELNQHLFDAIREWIEALTSGGPLIISLSDMHWSDASALELLKHCLPIIDSAPLLWILTFRPERNTPVWSFRHYLETEYPHRLQKIVLSALSEAESMDFIAKTIGVDALPVETVGLIIANAEGNPYYIHELIDSLIEQGVLARDEHSGRWYATREVTSLDLPDSLQTLLKAQIGQLSLEERSVLESAAVIGVDFWYSVLEEVVGEEIPLRQHLTKLQRLQFIQERGQVPELGMHYSFQSSLLRDAAYESLLPDQRQQAHLQIAEYLEGCLNEEFLSQNYGLLAFQFASARRPKKELFYTLQAADRARQKYAHEEALRWYGRAVELLDELSQEGPDPNQALSLQMARIEVLQGSLEIYTISGQRRRAKEDAEALLALARKENSQPGWLIEALLVQPAVTAWESKEECLQGMPLVEEALLLAREANDRENELRGLSIMTRQLITIGDPKWSEVGEQALALAREMKQRSYEAKILQALGTAYSWSDEPERGMSYLKAALPICKELDDRVTIVQLMQHIGLAQERTGDYTRLLSQFHEARLAISREIGYRQGEAAALIACGQTRAIYLGDYEHGLEELEEASRVTKVKFLALLAGLRKVQTYVMMDRIDQAENILAAMDGTNDDRYFYNARAAARLVQSIYQFHRSCDDEGLMQALEAIRQALELVDTVPLMSRQYAAAAYCLASAIHLKLALCQDIEDRREHHRAEALRNSQEAVSIFSQSGFMQIVEVTSEEITFRHSQALAASGRGEEAAEMVRQAYEEMMRKFKLIPAASPYKKTYLDRIPLHREITAAYHSAFLTGE